MRTPGVTGSEELAQLFCALHDGVVESAELSGGDLILKVEIKSLAERIHPTFTRFSVRLLQVEKLSFAPWPTDTSAPAPAPLAAVTDIFDSPLEILEGEGASGAVDVVCARQSPRASHGGGVLSFRAEGATITDEAGKSYSLPEVRALCEAHWTEWSKRT